jgi:hypothetical protein
MPAWQSQRRVATQSPACSRMPFRCTRSYFRRRKYVLIISETDSLSKKLIGWVNKQLKFNELLREDFGVLLHERNQQNEKDNEEAFITLSNTLIEASSSGKQLRGKRHGAVRPDLVIIDDPSSMNNEGTKEAREKLVHWFNSVVVPIGRRRQRSSSSVRWSARPACSITCSSGRTLSRRFMGR